MADPAVTINYLAGLTGLHRDTIKRRLRNVKACCKYRGHPAYDLAEALHAICRRDTIDPDKLSPIERKAWFDSEVLQRRLRDQDRELIPADEVTAALVAASGAIAGGLRSLRDAIARLGVDPDMLDQIDAILEAEAAALDDRLAALGGEVEATAATLTK